MDWIYLGQIYSQTRYTLAKHMGVRSMENIFQWLAQLVEN